MKTSARQLARAFVSLADGKSGKELDAAAASFVRFLAERHELGTWREVMRQVDGAWKEKYGVANVRVVSAHPLTPRALAALEKAGAGASLTNQTDPALIAGSVIRIDDRVIDASASGQLAALKTKLAA